LKYGVALHNVVMINENGIGITFSAILYVKIVVYAVAKP
jgi:hypothetical protein